MREIKHKIMNTVHFVLSFLFLYFFSFVWQVCHVLESQFTTAGGSYEARGFFSCTLKMGEKNNLEAFSQFPQW